MAETRTYQGHVYQRNAPGEPWVMVGPATPRPVTIGQGDPNRPVRSSAEATQAVNEAAASGYDPALAEAELRGRELALRERQIEIEEKTAEREDAEVQAGAKTLRQRLRTDNLLDSIAAIRRIASKGGTGYASILSALPETSARELKNELSPVLASLSFDRLQEMRDESKTGGALGQVSERELDLLQSAVAGLDTGVSLESFLRNLEKVERHFINSQMALSGIDPHSDEGREVFTQYSTIPFRSDDGSPLSEEQQRLLDAFYASNPNYTAEQLLDFTRSVGMPELVNAEEIVAARDRGLGTAPAAKAVFGPEQDRLPQGLSGANEGIAALLGLPVDAVTGAINLTTGGMNWLNELVGGSPEANIPRIDNPVGGSRWMQDQFADTGFIGPDAQTDAGQFWRRTGQSVGGSMVPGLGVGRTAGSVAAALLSGLGGGMGAATAQDWFPDSLPAEIGGEILGSLALGGPAVGLATHAGRQNIRQAVPTVDELKETAGNLYSQAEARGVVAGPELTEQLAEELTDIGRREALISAKGRVSEAYPKIAPVLKTIQDEAGETLNPKRIQVLRETLADAAYTTEGKEQKIARDMLRAFDDVTVPLAPELSEARDVASRYLQARPIDEAINLASTREGQYSQSGLDNALRTDFANLERRAIRGNEQFAPEVLQSIGDVARPSGARAAARWAGRLAPTSVISGAPGGSAFGIGALAGEPVLGGLIGGGIYGTGFAGRSVANALARQQAEDAVLMARSGGSMRLPGAMDTEASDAVAAALSGQSAPYLAAGGIGDEVARELLINMIEFQQGD